MQSGRFILAVILMIAVVIITNVIFPPVKRGDVTPADSISRPVQSTGAPSTDASSTGTPAGAPSTRAGELSTNGETPARDGAAPDAARDAAAQSADVAAAAARASMPSRADTVVVESSLYRYGISTTGASLVSAEMLEWSSYTRNGPVQLAPRAPRGLLSYRLQIGDRQVDLMKLSFVPNTRHLKLEDGSGPRVLRFTHSSAQWGTIEVSYEFSPDKYLTHVDVAVRNTIAPATRLLLDFGPRIAINEARAAEDERALAYVVNNQNEGIHSVPLRSVKDERIDEGPLDWVALKNKYFVAAALADQSEGAKPFGGVLADPSTEKYAANVTATLPAQQDGTFSYRLYVGPQEFDRLNALGDRFQDVNPYGWRIFRPIIRPLGHFITWMVLSLHEALAISYGWILILFGVVIRLILWPLNAKAMRSQLKNMEIQPRLKEIQAKYKGEPEKLQREMIKLYKEEGFNPMGGCLPMLIPFPVLITLYFVFQSTIQFRGVSFLWLPDLSRPDPLYILPIVLGVTMLLQQWLSSKTSPPNPQMKFMLWFMPLFMMMIFFNLASGLNLYYASQNIPGFFQQMQLTRERQQRQQKR